MCFIQLVLLCNVLEAIISFIREKLREQDFGVLLTTQ